MRNLTPERLRELLLYDAVTGIFRWRTSRGGAHAGTIAGSLNSRGYRQICIDCHLYPAHRLAWLYVYGVWPVDQIDHRNLDKDDNSIANLREATNVENARNRRRRSDNTTGYKGVSFHKATGKFTAIITINGKNVSLGYFDLARDAHGAYTKEARRLYGEFARVA